MLGSPSTRRSMDFRWSRTSAERVSSSSIKRKLGSIYRDRRGARRGAAISAARDRGDCHHHRNSPGKVDISSAEPNKIDRRRACSAGIPYDLRITIKAPSRNPHPPSETGNKAISKAGGIVATHWPKDSGAPAPFSFLVLVQPKIHLDRNLSGHRLAVQSRRSEAPTVDGLDRLLV